jgi:hypothetical protein
MVVALAVGPGALAVTWPPTAPLGRVALAKPHRSRVPPSTTLAAAAAVLITSSEQPAALEDLAAVGKGKVTKETL